MKTNTKRITASIREDLARRFTELTRKIGVSGTALLTKTLPRELDYLAEISSNSETAQKIWPLAKLTWATIKTRPMRFNVTLDRQDADRMDQLCVSKGVPRDIFIETYVSFLVNGTSEVCEGPLAKISAILANPRHEYEQNQNKSRGESRENPYRFLHLSEEVIEIVRDQWNASLIKERTGEQS